MKLGVNKNERELITTISMYLLKNESLRSQFWNIKSVFYDHHKQEVRIGISTINGKLGTTLQKLRKTCKGLADFLYEHGQTFKHAHIIFFVDKDDEKINKVYNILEKIEAK